MNKKLFETSPSTIVEPTVSFDWTYYWLEKYDADGNINRSSWI